MDVMRPLLSFSMSPSCSSVRRLRSTSCSRVGPRGTPAVELALRKLDTVGTLMMTTAHPDDENNALLAYYGLGKGMRTTLVTATRGNGGQNEIGPEIFESLAVLRTEELLAAHRFDGAEQYFTRAVDFGFSFSVDETLERWGHEEILGDYVRMIRTIRPEVIVGFVWDDEGGGQHHQASSRLRRGIPRRGGPEQVSRADHGRPEAVAGVEVLLHGRLRSRAGAHAAADRPGCHRSRRVRGGNAFDPLLGRTYNELGGEARSMHMCQGMPQLLPLPGTPDSGGRHPRLSLRDTVLPEGVDQKGPVRRRRCQRSSSWPPTRGPTLRWR